MSPDLKMTITGIQELQKANADIIHELKPSGARGRAVKFGLIEGHRYGVAITHVGRYKVGGVWVGGGSLRASHRMKYNPGPPSGEIFIDPSTRNPVTNQPPSIYGVHEHARGGGHAFYGRVEQERSKVISDGMIDILVRAFPKGD